MAYDRRDRWKWGLLSVGICLGIVLAMQLAIEIISRFKRPPTYSYEYSVDAFLNGKRKSIILDSPDDVMNHYEWIPVDSDAEKRPSVMEDGKKD
jgi:hypothetical protein